MYFFFLYYTATAEIYTYGHTRSLHSALPLLVRLYLQAVCGATAFVAGLERLPLSLTFVLVSSHSGRLVARFGPRAVMTAGMALMGAGLLILAGLSVDTGLLTEIGRAHV